MIADLQKRKLKLLEMRRGSLEIWAHPESHKRYVIGVDTSSGGPKGDYAVAAVCETVTRSLEALYRTKRHPSEWGELCAKLGWYYNTALLAFETHPSQHGLAACNGARDKGYPALFRRRQETTITRQMTEELGWATTVRTKGLMIDKVHVALKEGYEIPSGILLRELQGGKYKENGDPRFDGHDDCFVAFAIAQKVCDFAVQTGFVSTEAPREKDSTELWWEHRKAGWEVGESQGANSAIPIYDGI